MFASSPQAPASDVQAFEIERYEKTSDGVRCFLANGTALVVTSYKLRGIIPYPKQFEGGDPKLPEKMEMFKAYALKYPLTQPLLNPKIAEMTNAGEKAKATADRVRKEDEQIAAARKQKLEFAKSQRAKGLDKYNGQWIPKAQAEAHIAHDEAELNAAVAQAKAQDKTVASMVMLRGTVDDFTSEGMLVDSNYGSENMPNAIIDPKGRPELRFGHFLLTGHPKQGNKVNDSWFDVDAVYDGVFEYTTVLGGARRVHRFRVVKAYY